MLYSYDVFETVLYRKLPRSIDIFQVMDAKYEVKKIWNNDQVRFSKCRQYGEFVLRRISRKELTIDVIYSSAIKHYVNNKNDRERLKQIELQTECEYSILNCNICNEIKELLETGNRVVLISDMYWSGEEIRKILTDKDQMFKDVPIYSSCDWNASKKKGSLFKVVKDVEKADYAYWKHTGDNKYSDYSVPTSLGITCKLIECCRRYDFEKRIVSLGGDAQKIYGLIAEHRQNSRGYAYDLGLSFAAPMVYMYIEWVLRTAEEKGVDKLYFVLRDGYILKKVADIIIEKRKLSIATEYVFGSRVAWRLPLVTEESLRAMSVLDKSNWIFRYPSYAYVPYERLGFSRAVLESLFGADFCKKTIYSFRKFKETINSVLKDNRFQNELKNNVHVARVNTLAYFSEVIDWNSSFAFVDTNSTGKSQKDLNFIINKDKPIRFFYHTYLSDDLDNRTQFAYNLSGELKSDDRIPEVLFRAPYQQCYGYLTSDHGEVKPIFIQRSYNAWNDRFNYEDYLSGILAFTNAVEDQQSADGICVDMSEYANLLVRVANFEIISKDIMTQIGAIPFNPDLDGNECIDFYPKLKFNALLHPFTRLIYYPKGSFYNSARPWRILYQLLYWLVKKGRKHNSG